MGFGNGTDIHAILPVYDSKLRPATSGFPVIGQIVHTVVPELCSNWQIFDAQRSDQVSHGTVEGTIRRIDSAKDYRSKPSRLPVFKIGLGDCVELLALKSKVRPCVVLATADGIPDLRLPQAQRNIAREAFVRPSALVAPAYSVATPSEPRAMTVTIAARAECLVYPELVFLPRSGGIIKQDSVVRLDRAFWTALPPPTELQALSLSMHRQAVLHGQILTMQGRAVDQDYIDLVELLRGELAPEHAEHLT